MKKGIVGLFILMLMVSFSAKSYAQDKDISEALKKVVMDNFKGYEEENLEKVMNTVHSQSPGYIQTKELSKQIFPYYDLKYQLLSFNFIATDGDYALARGKQKTVKIEGPAFQNNIVDLIYVFKQENGQWKFWSQAILETKFVE